MVFSSPLKSSSGIRMRPKMTNFKILFMLIRLDFCRFLKTLCSQPLRSWMRSTRLRSKLFWIDKSRVRANKQPKTTSTSLWLILCFLYFKIWYQMDIWKICAECTLKEKESSCLKWTMAPSSFHQKDLVSLKKNKWKIKSRKKAWRVWKVKN